MERDAEDTAGLRGVIETGDPLPDTVSGSPLKGPFELKAEGAVGREGRAAGGGPL